MPTKTLGPWKGGLNLINNRELSVFLADSELGEAENVTFTAEGFVQPRPGFKILLDNGATDMYVGMAPAPPPPAAQNSFIFLGSVVTDTGTWAILEKRHGSNTKIFKVKDENINTGDTNIVLLYEESLNTSYRGMVVHTGFLTDQNLSGYTYPADTGVLIFSVTGGRVLKLPLDLVVDGSHPVVVIGSPYSIPRCSYATIVKDRLFLFDYYSSTMWWSPANFILDFRTDAATIAIAPYGNDCSGQEIVEPVGQASGYINAVEFYNNNFYIFKRNSTFMFTYQLSPLTDGYMRKISSDMGAFDSCIHREKIIVINDRGVFRVEGTEFIDLQSKMDFKFEMPLSRISYIFDNRVVFITTFNNNILFGLIDKFTDANNPKNIYYCMNTDTGAWSKWSFDYAASIAMPMSPPMVCQSDITNREKYLFLTPDGKRLVYINAKPDQGYKDAASVVYPPTYDYHLDSDITNAKVRSTLYFPNVAIKTTANVGGSIINFKKLYRYYLRMYLSEVPALLTDPPVWTLSVNYNNYTFDSTMNPIFGLYPASQPFPDPLIAGTVTTANYLRTYQVRIPQQRVKEFVFEIKRRFNSIASDVIINNPDADRRIKAGYYFRLAGLWFDYEDKTKI